MEFLFLKVKGNSHSLVLKELPLLKRISVLFILNRSRLKFSDQRNSPKDKIAKVAVGKGHQEVGCMSL